MVAVLAAASVVLTCHAQEPEGWISDAFATDMSLPLPTVGGGLPFSPPGGVGIESIGNAADVITPEIQALADGLDHDPARLFVWVRNNIRFIHYYGCKKGAALTMWERSGNDADQSALLVALLRASGLTARYATAFSVLPDVDSVAGNDWTHYLGIDATNLNVLASAVFNGGTPSGSFGQASGYPSNYYALTRYWVQLSSGGSWVNLDPSFKPSDAVAGSANVATQSGYDRTALLAAAGGTVGSNSISGISETGLGAHLDSKAQALLGQINANASVEEAFGTRRVRALQPPLPLTLSTLGAFPLPTLGAITTMDALPDSIFSTVQLQLSAVGSTTYTINKTFKLAELQGQKFALTFDGTGGAARLWLDEVVAATESPVAAGSSASIKVTIVHPHGGAHNQVDTKTYLRGGAYAFAYGFDPGPDLLRARLDKLATYKTAGVADTDNRVITESLNVIGLSWLRQSELSANLLRQAVNLGETNQHRFGRVAQEGSYYVDVPMQYSSPFRRTATQTSADALALLHAESFVASAMEHGVLAQQQAAQNAVSTVRLVSINNTNSQPTYLATNANWSTVRTLLTGYGAELTKLDTAFATTGVSTTALLPKNGSITQDQWHGAGYVMEQVAASGATNLQMLISGALSGGYNSVPGYVASAPPVTNYQSDPIVVTGTLGTNSRLYGGDPVNLSTGQFTVDAPVSLTLDNRPLPRGLAFAPTYDGQRRTNKDAGLGYGWDFNLNAKLTKRSDPDSALGLGSASQSTVAIFGAYALIDLCRNLSAAKDWTVVQLVAKWMVDPLANNAYSLTLNGSAHQFQKIPGGTYANPTGSTLSLAPNGAVMEVKERNGSTYRFNVAGKLTEVEDLWGKKATFTYDATNGWLTQVKDAYNRVFNFTWDTANKRLTTVTDPQSSPARTIGLGYDPASGDLITLTDPEGKADHFEYDASHHLTFHRDPQNRVIVRNTVFDASHRVKEQLSQGAVDRLWKFYYAPGSTLVKDPAGAVTEHQFDDRGREVASIDGLGHRHKAAYDGQDHRTLTLSPLAATTSATYDGNQNLLTSTDRSGLMTQFTYDAQNHLQTATDPNLHTVTCYYNAKHQCTKTSHTVDGVLMETINAYDPLTGTLTTVTDPDGNTTTFQYNSLDQLWKVTPPGSSLSTITTYTAAGDPLTVTDLRGHVTTFFYTKRREPTGSTTTATLADGSTQTIAPSRAYDDSRDLVTETDARGFSTTHTYSATGKLLTTRLPGATLDAITNTYDTRDLLAGSLKLLDGQTTPPLQRLSAFSYDAATRPTQTVSSLTATLNQSNATGYDADDRPVTLTDPRSKDTIIAIDDALRTVTTTDPLPRTRIVHRDKNGNVDTRTDGRNKVWQFLYDSGNRPKQTTSPEGRISLQTWNKRSLLETATEISGQQTTLGYDARSRLTSEVGADYSRSFGYDDNNNPLTVSETSGGSTRTLTRTFDEVNRVKTFTNESGETLTYIWDANGNLKTLIYPDGEITVNCPDGKRSVSYLYDSRNRLTTVTDWANRQTTFDWDDGNRLTKITRPNGTIRSLSYDIGSRVTRIEERLPGNRIITVDKLTYDVGSRLTDRFTVPVPPHWQEPNDSATYDNDNRLLTFNGADLAHDTDGNLLGAPTPKSTSATFTWDARNRLLSSAQPESATTGYSYDPEGRLNQLTSGGVATRFTINPHGAGLSQVLVRTNTATGAKTRCVYGLGLLYEERPDGSLRYYHYDHLGSTTALTDATAKITGRAHYSPYGGLVLSVGDITSTPFLFNGRHGVLYDSATGLLQMRARFYNPRLKRFLNADPAGFSGGWNFYAYAGGNPVSYLDPFGLGRQSAQDLNDWTSLPTSPGRYEQQQADLAQIRRMPAPSVWSQIGQAVTYTGDFVSQPVGSFGGGQDLAFDTRQPANQLGMAVSQLSGVGIGSGPRVSAGGGLIGVSEGEATALARQIHGIEVNGQAAVLSVEAFGSRAGSLFRGRGPTAASDLDILVTLNSNAATPAGLRAIDAELNEITTLFQQAKGLPVNPVIQIPGLPSVKLELQQTPFILLKP